MRPIVTEKSMNGSNVGKFTFAIAKKATKTDIKKAVEEKFNVHVVRISTTMVKGKTKRVGARRTEVAQEVWKKATITLKKGEKISLFESGDTDKK